MYISEKYGLGRKSLDEACAAIERMFNLPMEARESSFYGGPYFMLEVGESRIRLYNNWDPYDHERIDNGMIEPEFPDHDVIMRLSETAPDIHFQPLIERHPDIFVKLPRPPRKAAR